MFRCFWITPIFQLNVLMTDFLFHIYSNIYNKISHEPFRTQTQGGHLFRETPRDRQNTEQEPWCCRSTREFCCKHHFRLLQSYRNTMRRHFTGGHHGARTSDPGSWVESLRYHRGARVLVLAACIDFGAGGIHPPIPNHNQGPIHSYGSQDFNPARYLGPNPPVLWAQKPVLTGVK